MISSSITLSFCVSEIVLISSSEYSFTLIKSPDAQVVGLGQPLVDDRDGTAIVNFILTYHSSLRQLHDASANLFICGDITPSDTMFGV